MPPVISKYVTNKAIASAASVSILYLIIRLQQNRRKKLDKDTVQYLVKDKTPKKSKAQVDGRFFKQLRYLLGIIIPSPFSKEFAYLLLVAGSLVSRSLCDLWLIQHSTQIESSIINMDRQLFINHLLHFISAMPLISVVNNVLKFGIGELKIRFRNRMATHLYNQYIKGLTYYRMTNLDTRIANADQILTTDVDKFCESVTDLYSNISKPLLDICIYVYRLSITVGPKTPGILLAYLFVSGLTLTYIRKPIAKFTVEEQRFEGEHRYIHSRLIANSEEIAFYQGGNREKLIMLSSLQKLINHLRGFLEFRLIMGVADNIIGKYIATGIGFIAVSVPFLNSSHSILGKVGKNKRFEHYYVYGRMLLKLAEAIGRLVLSGRELTRLAGFTSRVTELSNVLADLNKGTYTRTQVTDSPVVSLSNRGKIIFKDNIICFDHVPLVTPNGEILIEDLTFTVQAGNNVLICGPNGCGKSSMFRILGELWPLFGGTLTKPPSGKLFYIPQRPYMTLGTLRDQVIYPHSQQELCRRGITDEDLQKHLERVQLAYLLDRSGGWDRVDDWIDVLSGGEKQRIAMARLFYHKPQFAILDECTSAVSVDVEGSMYQHCRNVGITLFTVSHRKSLWKHHEYYLRMDGRGFYEYKPISADTEEFGS